MHKTMHIFTKIFKMEEKKMKKFTALLLAFILTFSLAACGGSNACVWFRKLCECIENEKDEENFR